MKNFPKGNPYSIRDNAVQAQTWFVDPEKTADWVIAFLVCPECGSVASLSCREFSITRDGVVDKEWACKGRGRDGTFCLFKDFLTFDSWEPRETEKLFAIAFQHWTPRGWVAKIDYTHAMNELRAKFVFQTTVKDPRLVRGVVVGRAVGFFVDDKQGMRLSA